MKCDVSLCIFISLPVQPPVSNHFIQPAYCSAASHLHSAPSKTPPATDTSLDNWLHSSVYIANKKRYLSTLDSLPFYCFYKPIMINKNLADVLLLAKALYFSSRLNTFQSLDLYNHWWIGYKKGVQESSFNHNTSCRPLLWAVNLILSTPKLWNNAAGIHSPINLSDTSRAVQVTNLDQQAKIIQL